MINKIGFDIEYFVKDLGSNKIVSASGKLGATKSSPKEVIYKNSWDPAIGDEPYLLSEDNVCIEIAAPPSTTLEYFQTRLRQAHTLVNIELSKVFNADHVAMERSYHIFNQDELSLPGELTFGCDPDYCAYTLKEINPNRRGILKKYKAEGLRTAGFHLHIDLPEDMDKALFVRALDYRLLPLIRDADPGAPRRLLYGRAGSMRMKPYGVEYRVLSSAAVNQALDRSWNTNTIMIWETVVDTINMVQEEPNIGKLLDENKVQVINSINQKAEGLRLLEEQLKNAA